MFLVGANAQAGWLYVIAAAFVGVVAAGMIAPPLLVRRISATREVPPVVCVGDEVPVSLSLVNESRGKKGPLAGTDFLLTPKTFLLDALGPGGTADLVLTSAAARRGAHERAELRLETGAPFGIGKARKTLDLESPLVVHPAWAPMATFPLLESASTPNEALHERPRRGSGTDFYGLREYRPGDSVRRVHWRSSARGANLLVKEYEEHIGSRVSILIAGPALGDEPFTSFEVSVSSAASVVMYGLDAGHPVQLFCDTAAGIAHLFEPGKAEALDWMARLEPGAGHGVGGLADFASSEIYRRSTNVLVFPTDRRTADAVPGAVARLQDLATRVIAIAVSARTFDAGGPVLAEQDERKFLARLAGMRVIVYSVEHGKELAECLREPLPV